MFGRGCRHDRYEMDGRGRGGAHEGRERMHRGEGGGGYRGFGPGPGGGGGGGGGGGMGRGRGGGGPMGRGRFFDHGDLKLLILALVAERPRHGYEIIKDIEEKVGGAYSPSPGVVYPTLSMLEDLGHITVEAAPGNRKLSQITEAGRAYLQDNAAEVKIIFARMASAADASPGERSPQLIRAMESLKLALRLKFAGGALQPTQIDAMTAALDEAVAKIEKC